MRFLVSRLPEGSSASTTSGLLMSARATAALCLSPPDSWPGRWEAYYDNGRAHSGYDVVEWAKRGAALGAGEILLTSVDCEGLQSGMDLELIRAVTDAVSVPVICGGGVGCGDDIADASNAGADAVACAAVLHYNKESVAELKDDLRADGVEVRCV